MIKQPEGINILDALKSGIKWLGEQVTKYFQWVASIEVEQALPGAKSTLALRGIDSSDPNYNEYLIQEIKAQISLYGVAFCSVAPEKRALGKAV